MDINAAFPSKYIKAADLQGRDVTCAIDRVEITDVTGSGNEEDIKPVMYFVGKEKGLVLNKTNATTISGLYGPDTDNWLGESVTLFPTQTDFQGRPVACIRIRMQAPKAAAAVAKVKAATKTKAKAGYDEPITEDDIPF